MPAIAHEWELDIERGPNWLLVKVRGGDVAASHLPSLAERLRTLLEQHFTYRLVLEVDEIDLPCSHLIRQLEMLDEWVHAHDGVIRLCGLLPVHTKLLRRCGLDDRFPGLHRSGRSRVGTSSARAAEVRVSSLYVRR